MGFHWLTVIATRSEVVTPASSVHVHSSSPRRFSSSEKREIRVGGNAGKQLGVEHLLAVIPTHKRMHDILWNLVADVVISQAGFHGMADEQAHLKNLAGCRAAAEREFSPSP